MKRAAVAAVLLIAAACAAQDTRPAVPDLVVETNFFLEMHYALRARAAALQKSTDPAPEATTPFEFAVATLIDLESQIGGAGNWPLIEANLGGCKSSTDLRVLAERAPERAKTRTGVEMPLRSVLSALATTYESLELEFRGEKWPERRAVLREATERLRLRDDEVWRRCIEHVTESLSIAPPREGVRVVLVTEAPFPGGFTYRTRGGGAYCVVAVSDRPGALLEEVVLHEAIHVLDAADPEKTNRLNRLRTLLREAPPKREAGQAVRDIPHTVVFVQAAATVRKIIDPKHEDYGLTSGYYERVSGGERVREIWQQALEGDASLDEAISRLAKIE